MNNKKEVFIRNPMRAIKSQHVQEPYIPEHQRLIASGDLKGAPIESDLADHQAQLRAQIIKELQMAPKVMVPSVGHQDIAWNKQATFYDEPLSPSPIYDNNLIRNDLSVEELENEQIKDFSTVPNNSASEKKPVHPVKDEYSPPTSLDQLNNNEIIIIANEKVIFSSLNEEEIKNKLAHLIFEENLNPDKILVIKRLPISISVNLS